MKTDAFFFQLVFFFVTMRSFSFPQPHRATTRARKASTRDKPRERSSLQESRALFFRLSNSSRDSRRNVRQGSEMVMKITKWLSLGPDDFTPENRQAKALANYGAFASEYLSPTLRQTWPRE